MNIFFHFLILQILGKRNTFDKVPNIQNGRAQSSRALDSIQYFWFPIHPNNSEIPNSNFCVSWRFWGQLSI